MAVLVSWRRTTAVAAAAGSTDQHISYYWSYVSEVLADKHPEPCSFPVPFPRIAQRPAALVLCVPVCTCACLFLSLCHPVVVRSLGGGMGGGGGWRGRDVFWFFFTAWHLAGLHGDDPVFARRLLHHRGLHPDDHMGPGQTPRLPEGVPGLPHPALLHHPLHLVDARRDAGWKNGLNYCHSTSVPHHLSAEYSDPHPPYPHPHPHPPRFFDLGVAMSLMFNAEEPRGLLSCSFPRH